MLTHRIHIAAPPPCRSTRQSGRAHKQPAVAITHRTAAVRRCMRRKVATAATAATAAVHTAAVRVVGRRRSLSLSPLDRVDSVPLSRRTRAAAQVLRPAVWEVSRTLRLRLPLVPRSSPPCRTARPLWALPPFARLSQQSLGSRSPRSLPVARPSTVRRVSSRRASLSSTMRCSSIPSCPRQDRQSRTTSSPVSRRAPRATSTFSRSWLRRNLLQRTLLPLSRLISRRRSRRPTVTVRPCRRKRRARRGALRRRRRLRLARLRRGRRRRSEDSLFEVCFLYSLIFSESRI